MKRAIPLIVFLLLGGLAAPRAQSFELSPFYGYRVGGDFDDVPSSIVTELEIQNSDSYGLTFGYAFNDKFELEGLWSVQDTDLEIFLASAPTLTLDFQVQYFHVGGIVLSGDSLDTKRGFFSFSAGVVSFDPEKAKDETYFSWSIGGGGKFYSCRHPLFPARGLFVRQQFRLAGGDIAHQPHAIGMIGDDQPVQRT